MNKWLPTLTLLVGGVIDKISPTVQAALLAWAQHHPTAAVLVALAGAWVLHLLPSPLQPNADPGNKSLGSALKMLAIIGVVLAASVPVHAQNHYEVGVSFDPSTQPRFKGVASFLTPVDTGSTFSFSTALFDKPVNGRVSYSLQTGIRRKSPVQPIPGFTLWVDAQGGVAISPSATSGGFIGGGALTKPMKNFTVVLTGKAYVIPVSGGTSTQVTAGVQF